MILLYSAHPNGQCTGSKHAGYPRALDRVKDATKVSPAQGGSADHRSQDYAAWRLGEVKIHQVQRPYICIGYHGYVWLQGCGSWRVYMQLSRGLQAQHTVFWSGIYQDLEEVTAQCRACNIKQPWKAALPPIPLVSPDYLFQIIVADYFTIKAKPGWSWPTGSPIGYRCSTSPKEVTAK